MGNLDSGVKIHKNAHAGGLETTKGAIIQKSTPGLKSKGGSPVPGTEGKGQSQLYWL